ncbi:MAG TPA: carboxypeptidase-like regulatory domain-containing protein, partial [Candidatus Cloacimonadota bacterium]|nr:carboxypeptidase-like regulatory domain-containing protein [Candidatus Cloacimonadota bacterium]
MIKQVGILSVILFMCLIPKLHGITGQILSEAGSGIEGASITDGRQYVFSDDNGNFRIDTRADSLQISRIGYLPRVLNTRSLASPIILKADTPSLEPIWVRAEYRTYEPTLGAN